MLVHVLHVDDGVVDERADGYGETTEGHGVDADAEGVEHYHRHEERDGYRDERNERGAHVGKEEHKDDNHEDGSLDERLLHVVDAALDEVCLTEDVGRDMHVGGQGLLEVVECEVEMLSEVDGARIGLLRNGEEHG